MVRNKIIHAANGDQARRCQPVLDWLIDRKVSDRRAVLCALYRPATRPRRHD